MRTLEEIRNKLYEYTLFKHKIESGNQGYDFIEFIRLPDDGYITLKLKFIDGKIYINVNDDRIDYQTVYKILEINTSELSQDEELQMIMMYFS